MDGSQPNAERAPVDMLVVGGGVNGCGVARDAAGRGLSVTLVESNDLAGATSSASSKLIHGGLRYLEYYEFRLVREALSEREVLLRSAPHLIRALRFVLPHHAGLRPAWVLRIGLFLYDHIGGRRTLPGTRSVSFADDPVGAPLKSSYRRGFEYSDAWVDDARLVVDLALDAEARGARILTRTRFVEARREAALWRAVIHHADGAAETIRARALVNAAGPWVQQVRRATGVNDGVESVKLIKGSHIVVPALCDGPQAYTLQGGDGRVVFAVPYERGHTLIGTTDVEFDGDPRGIAASTEEIAYLCTSASDYFKATITPADVVWSYAGVRPLHDDGKSNASAVTRDYVFDLNAPGGAAPLLSIYGGKITTFRRLAEHAMRELKKPMGFKAGPWTAKAALPGGDIPNADFEAFRTAMASAHPWIGEPHLTRLCRAYGSRLPLVLDGAASWAEMGAAHGAGLTDREVAYLVRSEWALTAEDVLWRRTKLGLHMTTEERSAFAARFDTRHGQSAVDPAAA